MPAQLSPCPGCQRHIRITEPSCPFCHVAVEVSGSTSQMASLREHATAIFMGVTLALAGCNTKPEENKKPTPVDVKPDPQPATKPDPGAVVTPPATTSAPTPPLDPAAVKAEYGAPIPPAPTPKPDPIAPAPEYGAPMPPPAIHTKYGAPPPPSMMPRYGAPPLPK